MERTSMKIIFLNIKDKILFIKSEKNIYKIKIIPSSSIEGGISAYIYNINQIIELSSSHKSNSQDSIENKFENEIKSPIEGKLISICASIGAKVLKNQPLAVIESMKMENEITASTPLILKKVCVKIGDLVKQRQILMLAEKEE
jgi:biotin carboxyl carrier protein